MATVPISGTNIRILSNVPFANDYKNTRWFDTLLEQTTYFTNKTVVHSMAQANFQRIEGKHFIAVNKSIDELWSANYLMFQNAQYNNKWFYGFVTKLEYIQKNTTYVHFQIDVFQTWKFDMNFKPSFVVREHCKLWNTDGSPVINTVDEGLNYGHDYETVSIDNYRPYETVFFLVIVCKKTMHGGSADISKIKPMMNGSPQPLTYYVHPFKLNGGSPTVTVDGFDINLSPVTEVLYNLYTQTDAVNNIVSLYVTDYFGYNMNYSADTLTVSSNVLDHVTIQDLEAGLSINTLYTESIPSYNTLTKNMGSKYSGYASVSESKLLMHPYTSLVLDDFKGNRAEFKNEYISGNDLVLNVKGSLGVSNKVAFIVRDYLLNSGLPYSTDVALENSLINNTPNDIPIITDMLSAYLQGNRNSLETQKTSIIYNGIMGQIGNTIGGVASGATGNGFGVASSVTNVIGGLGSTILQLQAIESKQKDISNVPPQMAKMGSNTAFDFGNGYEGVYIIKKQIKSEYRKKLTDFFNMFGYKVNEVKMPNFHTRSNWNFVQTSSCNILGNFNNEDLQELKSVFDNGITFWHTDDVGNYSLENGVI